MCENGCGDSPDIVNIIGERGPIGPAGPKGVDGLLFAPDASGVTFNNDPLGTLPTVKDALLHLLYTPPLINSMSVTITGHDVNNLEKGTTVAGGAINVAYNITQKSKTITLKSISPNIGTLTNLIGTRTDPTSMTGNRTFTLTVSDGQTTVNSSYPIVFKDRIYFGVSSLSSMTGVQVQALTSELRTAKPTSKTYNPSVVSGGGYLYLIMPSTSAYTVSKFEFGSTTVGFISTPITLTVNGLSVGYTIFRSPEKLNSSSVTINIS